MRFKQIHHAASYVLYTSCFLPQAFGLAACNTLTPESLLLAQSLTSVSVKSYPTRQAFHNYPI